MEGVFKQLSFDMVERLDAKFTVDEFKTAVWNCGSDKALDLTVLLSGSLKDIGRL